MPRIVLKESESDRLLEAAATEATIGRDPASSLFIEGPNSKVVSAQHARIFYQDSAWWIEDSSRNGTILDDERLQQGQRHNLREGQLIGLGESGPRYRVMTLESRPVSETVLEPSADAAVANSTTAPRQPAVSRPPASVTPVPEARTAPLRKSEAARAGLNIKESTEPMSPSPDWLVHVILRATNTNQHYELRADVVRLGRSSDCNIQIPPEQGASVSRVHAEILIYDGGVIVRDSGSRNGTFLNGRRVDAPHSVVKNDLIMLGSGGPTFSIEDLHIVKGPSTPPREPSPGEGSSGVVNTPKTARLAQGLAASPALARHTSYRSEPPTAPADPHHNRAAKPAGVPRSAANDISDKNGRRTRVIIWAGLAVVLAGAAALLIARR